MYEEMYIIVTYINYEWRKISFKEGSGECIAWDDLSIRVSRLNRDNKYIICFYYGHRARAERTLNQSMTVATRQSTPINVTGCCNAIRKGAVAR